MVIEMTLEVQWKEEKTKKDNWRRNRKNLRRSKKQKKGREKLPNL